MKIALIEPAPATTTMAGVHVQAVMWCDGFNALGNEAELINFNEEHDWYSYDAVIFLGFGGSFRILCKSLSFVKDRYVLAPIIDPKWPKWIYKFIVKYWGSQKYFGLTSRFHDLYLCSPMMQLFFTRSNEETDYLSYACDVPRDRIFQIPLSVRFQPLKEMPEKENFCLHVSRLRADNKNVPRLIEAAKKLNFRLVLCGPLGSTGDRHWLDDMIKDTGNIEYVGAVSDEELKKLYARAKVFALPSTTEGVGMVAIEAAGYGAEIVLTDVGAPKEYWNGQARLVNPYTVDDIGQGVMECMDGRWKKQPELMRFIDEKYSLIACTKQLIDALKTIRK